MSMRFRKSLKLAPGVRLNVSGSGLSWSVGPRGASVNIGKRGAFLNTGIPGTGLYSRRQIASTTVSGKQPAKQTVSIAAKVNIDDTGNVVITGADDTPLSDQLVELAKKQHGDAIKAMIQAKCDEINSLVDVLARIHENTSSPDVAAFQPQAFEEPEPAPQALKIPGFFCRWFKSCMAKVDDANRLAAEAHRVALLSWNERKQQHNAEQQDSQQFFDRVQSGDLAAMTEWFERVLQDIEWPQETLVTFDFLSPGVVAIDVDLPEIESMPTKIAAAPLRGYKLSIKDLGATKVQKLYMNHVHAIGFRIAGEAFATSPSIKTVVISGFTQRASRASGQVRDEYLYSAQISRKQWGEINFQNLANLDPVEAFSRFELRRDMSKTGVFHAIEPFGAP